ncbi:hypothetical protein JQ615_41735 [Bradyrhizobium jicamae]|uniref:Transposase n=1 Tax=Bradyrhizobium jicamae TaxID=280332 RepID=A0ABS5FYJ6_9BRAD|nr:hypothetical protein [Bradyrhizobium jicamae]MBR0801852.1 hypothetical protein [Bradyrhizobium jicamae]MBR0939438.1 hypothetical protein [Bradyrhizobium jicamae]
MSAQDHRGRLRALRDVGWLQPPRVGLAGDNVALSGVDASQRRVIVRCQKKATRWLLTRLIGDPDARLAIL